MKPWVYLCFFMSWCSYATQVELAFVSVDNQPVRNVAVSVMPLNPSDSSGEKTLPMATMRQAGKQFDPHVLVVPTGTMVEFPNFDDVKHHVYSFSDAKTFELELYSEFQGTPIMFDKPGIVEIGCNIHDWMLAYIYVTDAPYHGSSNEQGKVLIEIPDGDYTVTVWHPGAVESDNARAQQISIAGTKQTLNWKFDNPIESPLDLLSGFDDY